MPRRARTPSTEERPLGRIRPSRSPTRSVGGLLRGVTAALGLVLGVCACAGSRVDGTTSDEATGVNAPVPTLRVLAYNVKHGRGMDGVVDLSRAAALIRSLEPDLVALQEIDCRCTRSGGVDQAQWLGEKTGMHAVFGRFMDYQGGEYGMAILSRWPILRAENHELPPGAEPRSALEVEVTVPSAASARSPVTLRFVGIHLYRTEDERMAQARRLLELFADSDAPVLLCGDFNSEPGSPVLDELATVWTAVDTGEDRFTFPSVDPNREIDFLLLRDRDGFQVELANVLDEPLVSDHRPLLTVLRWPKDSP